MERRAKYSGVCEDEYGLTIYCFLDKLREKSELKNKIIGLNEMKMR